MESVRMVLTESCAIFDWLTIAPSGPGILFPVQVRCRSVTDGGKVSYAKMKFGVYSARPCFWDVNPLFIGGEL